MSAGDPRGRHRGLSHHTATVLELLLGPVLVAVPEEGEGGPGGADKGARAGAVKPSAIPARHRRVAGTADVAGYRRSGLPARTMGRSIEQDELFFRAALAGGSVLGAEIAERAGGAAGEEAR